MKIEISVHIHPSNERHIEAVHADLRTIIRMLREALSLGESIQEAAADINESTAKLKTAVDANQPAAS